MLPNVFVQKLFANIEKLNMMIKMIFSEQFSNIQLSYHTLNVATAENWCNNNCHIDKLVDYSMPEQATVKI